MGRTGKPSLYTRLGSRLDAPARTKSWGRRVAYRWWCAGSCSRSGGGGRRRSRDRGGPARRRGGGGRDRSRSGSRGQEIGASHSLKQG